MRSNGLRGAAWAAAALLLGLHRDAAADPPKKWTVMVYCSADAPGEKAIMDDLRRIVAAGLQPNVRVLALVDRTKTGSGDKDQSGSPLVNDWGDTRLLLFERTSPSLPAVLTEVDPQNVERGMDDPDTLDFLLTTAETNYPAEHYALLMEGHGSGWSGICRDVNGLTTGQFLTVQSMAQTFANHVSCGKVVTGQPTHKLDLLVWYACYMSHLEVVAAMAPHADLMLASPDRLFAGSACYGEAFSSLSGTTTGLQLGQMLLDYRDWESCSAPPQCLGSGGRKYGFASLLVPAKAAEIVGPLNTLSQRLADLIAPGAAVDHVDDIGRWRASAEGYEGIVKKKKADVAMFKHRDLGDFCSRVSTDVATWPSSPTATALKQAADAVLAKVDAARPDVAASGVNLSRGADCPHAHGITVNFPASATGPGNGGYPDLLAFVREHQMVNLDPWLAFLTAFGPLIEGRQISLSDMPVVTPQGPGLGGDGDPPGAAASVTIGAQDLRRTARMSLVVGDDSSDPLLLGGLPVEIEMPAPGDTSTRTVTASWEGRWPALVGETSMLLPVRNARRTADGRGYIFDAPVMRTHAGVTDRLELRVVIEPHDVEPAQRVWEGRVLYARFHGDSGDGDEDEVDVHLPCQVGDVLVGIYATPPTDDCGSDDATYAGFGSARIGPDRTLKVVYAPLPADRSWAIGFVARNGQGVGTASPLVKVPPEALIVPLKKSGGVVPEKPPVPTPLVPR